MKQWIIKAIILLAIVVGPLMGYNSVIKGTGGVSRKVKKLTKTGVATNVFDEPIVPVSHTEPSIKDLEHNARTIFASVGAKITWYNDDDVVHNLRSDEGWFEAEVKPGETFTWQPTKAGIYHYRCTHHKNTQGVLVVSPGGAVAPKYYDGQSIAAYFTDACSGCHGVNRGGATGVSLIPGRLTADDKL